MYTHTLVLIPLYTCISSWHIIELIGIHINTTHYLRILDILGHYATFGLVGNGHWAYFSDDQIHVSAVLKAKAYMLVYSRQSAN